MSKKKVPTSPGFGFRPTDVELVQYYLKRKVLGKSFRFEVIPEVDVYMYAPWDLPEKSYWGSGESKWYFFCPRTWKYSRGGRLNRSTEMGYWKATGKDRTINYNSEVVGTKGTLVFYLGRAPKGDRTDWVMHEYRLKDKESADRGVAQDAYVLCVIRSRDGTKYGESFREEDWNDDGDNEHKGEVPANFIFSEGKIGSFSVSQPSDTSSPASKVTHRGMNEDDISEFMSFDLGEDKNEQDEILLDGFKPSFNWEGERESSYDKLLIGDDYVRETCGLVSNHQVSHSSSQRIQQSQAHISGTAFSNSNVSDCSWVCHVCDGGEELVSARRPKNISNSKQDLTSVDTPISWSCSVAKVPTQYLRKLVDLLLDAYPSRPFELTLRAECLLELYLSCGNIAQFQDLVNLKLVDLSDSNFTRMPDLSGSSKLQILSLQCCANVVEVSCVRYLSKLKYINLKGCTSLRSLPSVIALECLSSLDLSDCTNLRRLPPSMGSLSSLTSLDLRNCKMIQNLPRSICRLNSLQGLSISGCSKLMEHLSGIETSSSVEPFNRDSEEGLSPEEQQPGYLSSASQRTDIEAFPQPEVLSLDQPISKHSPKSSLQRPEEEGNGNKSNSEGEVKPSLKRTSHEMESTGSKDETKPSSPPTQKLAMISTQPRTSRPSSSSKNSDVILGSALLQQKEALKWYMDMSVEAIHQAGAFDDVERIVETLIQQSTDYHESANLEDLLHYLGEIQESVPDTLAHMNAAQTYRESLLLKLADIGLRLVEAAEEYNLLGAKFATLSEEEEKLEAEIQRLMANKEELVHVKN